MPANDGMTALIKKRIVTAVAVFVILAGPAAASAAGAATIRIGGNLELSGSYGYFGEIIAKGARMAFDEVNAAGGIRGQKIEFVLLDNAGDKAKAAVVMKSLAADGKVAAVLGCLTNATAFSAYQAAQDTRIPFISPFAANPRLIVNNGQINRFAFRSCLDDPYEGVVMARFAIDELGAKTAAIVIDNKSQYSKDLAATFEQTFTAAGGKIIAKDAVAAPASDYDQVGEPQIKDNGADVIFLPLGPREAAENISQLRGAGVRVPILGTDSLQGLPLVAITGEEALNNTYYFFPYASSPKLPQMDRFAEAFSKKYKMRFSQVASLGYEAALVIIEAVKKAGSSDPEAVQAALEGITVQGLNGPITIDAEHKVAKTAVVMKIIDGQPVPYRLFAPQN